MTRLAKTHLVLLGLLLWVLPLSHCSSPQSIADAEIKLLAVFQSEKTDLERFEDSTYVAYMEHQVAHFETKQKRAARYIGQINKNFEALSVKDRETYQKKWLVKFQPVIDHIYELTRSLIVKQTAVLTPKDMVRIQELTLQMNTLEKNTPDAKLKPTFFTTPYITEGEGIKPLP